MRGTGTLINAALIIAGSLVGLLFKKALSEKLKTTVFQALALCTMAIGLIGIIGAGLEITKDGLSSRFTLIMIMSMVFGSLIGELIDIDNKLNRFGAFVQKKLSKGEGSSFSQGFVTATLTYCVGSMAIVGSLNDGILNDPSVLIAKSILDGVISIVYASALGCGVLFSFVPVVLYQGLITIFSSFLSTFLTDAVITQMSLSGSVLIMGIGFNFIYEPKLRLANMLPATFIPLILYAFINLLP